MNIRAIAVLRNFLSGNKALRLLATSVLASAVLASGSAVAANKTRLSIYQHGKPVDYMPCQSQALKSRSAVLMGGGVDVPSAFTFMIKEMSVCADGSTGKPGNFVVARAGGNPSYDSYINKQGPVGAVITIVIPDRDSAIAVGDPTNEVGQQVQALMKTAGAIWLTGGDQSDYYNFWKGTPVEQLISNQVQQYGVPIGGTSAGMMILSEYNFIPDKAYSSGSALGNPTSMQQWLKRDFWSSKNKTPFFLLTNTVTDSHFDTRDRMGRLATFLADVITMHWSNAAGARAIGVDQEAALLLRYVPSNTGTSLMVDPPRIVANAGSAGAAYILTASNSSVINTTGALKFTNINVQKLYVDPATSNVATRSYQIKAENGYVTLLNGEINVY
jgi:cyanophycinase